VTPGVALRLVERWELYSFEKILLSHRICSYCLIVVSAKRNLRGKVGSVSGPWLVVEVVSGWGKSRH